MVFWKLLKYSLDGIVAFFNRAAFHCFHFRVVVMLYSICINIIEIVR